MPRGDRANWGGRRTTTRPDAKPTGRPKIFATVRLPLADARAVLAWLAAQHLDAAHPAERGLAFLVAGLWSETGKEREKQ